MSWERKIHFIETMDEDSLMKILRTPLTLRSASLMKGFDSSLLEVKTEGISSIISAIPSHQEIHGRSSSIIHSIGNPENLVRHVVDLESCKDLWHQLSKTGLQLAKRLWIELQGKEILAVLQQRIP
jgi:hypothetical protein